MRKGFIGKTSVCLGIICLLTTARVSAAESVSNVRSYRVSDEKMVVYYDLVATVAGNVVLEISRNGGGSFPITATTVSGDVGPGIMPGTRRRIEWNIAGDGIPPAENPVVRVVVVTGEGIRTPPEAPQAGSGLPQGDHDAQTGRYIRTPSLKAFLTGKPPVIDGILDDPCWREAEAITDFYQRNPRMGEPATFPVSVRIVYDPQTIYIAFEIHCGDPNALVSTVLQRDASVNAYDDHFGFRFDTFHNYRDLYYFYVNPRGTKLDGHAMDEGAINDDNWDGVWQVKTSLLADGWAGEIAMPLYNFRYRETEDATWGFACLVYVSALQENVSWPDMRKNSRKPSLFGNLTDLRGLGSKKPVVLIPYAIQGSQFGRHEKTVSDTPEWKPVSDTWEKDIGIDIRYRPSSFLETNLTINPDFATIEADQFLFNLSLDELQYAEKRPFFTEGQDRFDSPIQLLYTRRIGLGDDEVLAGGKMHGRVGSYDFGVLDALTGEGFDPSFNYTALRVKRDILRSSTVGLLAVGKNEASGGMETVNNALGLDLNFQISGAARLTGQVCRSYRPGETGDGYAGQADFQYSEKLFNPRDNIGLSATIVDATDDFDIQDIGYFGRTNLDRRGGKEGITYTYWVKSHGINRFAVSQNGWYYQNHAGDIRVQDGASAKFSVETFGLVQPGILVEKSYYYFPGDTMSYDNNQRTVSLQLGPYPRFRGEASYRTGDNFGSSIRYTDAGVIFKPSGHMTLTGNFSRLRSDPFDSSEGATVNNITRIGLNYLFTPDFYWRVFVQSDSSDRLSLVNTMIRYEFRPGSVFYLSYKETRDDSLDDFMTTDRQLLAKISYQFAVK
ncbi:carbohydrate binding family 9 domain-containing protein [bacterium]|nr:carbohydrate binding family 9 domain-containing protein [bacterium]